jgi:hypothetical protein
VPGKTQDTRLKTQDAGFRVQGSGMQDVGFRVQGSGFMHATRKMHDRV